MPHLHFGLETITPYALYLGAIAAFFASLRRPWIGLYLLALTLPLQTVRYWMFSLPFATHYVDFLVIGVILGALNSAKRKEFGNPLAGLLVLVAAFYYLSLWQGAFFLNWRLPLFLDNERLSNWKNYVEMFLFCGITARVIKDKKQAGWLLFIMAIAVLLVGKNFHDTMGDRDTSHYYESLREQGTLGYAGENGLAAFVTMMGAFFAGVAAYAKLSVKVGIYLVVATCVYCVLFSFSREAYVGALAAMVVLGLLRERKLLIACVVLFLAWATILPQSVQERISMTTVGSAEGEQFDSSSEERVSLWQDALDQYSTSPLLGTGFDTYEFMPHPGGFHDTHNYYIKMLLETGVVGLLLFLWLLARMGGFAFSLSRRALDPFWKSIGLGFVALLCSVAVLNFFGDRWSYQQLDGYMWILLGLVVRGLIVTREQYQQSVRTEIETEASALPEDLAEGVLRA